MKNASDQFQPPALLDRATSDKIALACLGVSLLAGVILAGLPSWIYGVVVILAVLLVVRRMSLCAVSIFILCVGYKFLFAWRLNLAQAGLTVGDVLFAFSMLAWVASSMRYVELDPRRFRWGNGWLDHKQPGIAPQQHGTSRANLRWISSSMLRIPVALLLALTLLAVLPEDVFWPNRFRFDPAVLRTVILAWLFLVALIFPASVVSLIKWRRLRPSQANIYLRRVLAGEVRREQKLVERGRYRRKQKLSATE